MRTRSFAAESHWHEPCFIDIHFDIDALLHRQQARKRKVGMVDCQMKIPSYRSSRNALPNEKLPDIFFIVVADVKCNVSMSDHPSSISFPCVLTNRFSASVVRPRSLPLNTTIL